jgi:purine nucleosidase
MLPVILDTDIGTDVDDAMALSLAVSLPELELRGVTTVHADAPLRARIARRLLELAGRPDIPVIAGASMPLQLPLPPNFTWMPCLRGHEGVGLLSAAELHRTEDLEQGADDAAHFIVAQARAHPGELRLITIGALTNVARALQLEPRLGGWLREITVMGGTVFAERFPFPPMLETNLNADPLAAQIVFASNVPLTIVPMEVTTQVFLVAHQRAEIAAWDRPLSRALVALMEQMFEGMASLSAEAGLSEDFYKGRTFMHDPLAVATAVGSDLVRIEPMHVQLEVIDQVIRTTPYADRAPNCNVSVGVDAPGFIDYWLRQIRTLAGA